MPHQTDAEETRTTGYALPVAAHKADELQAAVSDAHAARLHGFALLLTVGDEPRAAAAAIAALEAGREGIPEMQDPQRAAAWLRREVIGELRRTWPTPHLPPQERRAALGRMGVVEPLISALEGMSAERRAALVAGTIEQMGMADVATMLDTDTGGAYRAVEGARLDYITTAARTAGSSPPAAPGPLARRIGEIRAGAVDKLPVKESA
jgi:DNA-directed RNA polymerase specialized sigma24 family protein